MGKKVLRPNFELSKLSRHQAIELHLWFLFPTNNFYMYFIVPSPFTPYNPRFPTFSPSSSPIPSSFQSGQTKVANPLSLSRFPNFYQTSNLLSLIRNYFFSLERSEVYPCSLNSWPHLYHLCPPSAFMQIIQIHYGRDAWKGKDPPFHPGTYVNHVEDSPRG